MSNPFSGSEIPGMNAMGDTLSFVKKLWGSMQVPGMVAPPMSVDELDKKIQDLKTVESWLSVNMNMLRGTIQALEVQRATIAALQSLGESFAQHAQQASAMAEQAATPFSTKPAEEVHSNANWPMHPVADKTPEPDPDAEIDEDEDMPPDGEVKTQAESGTIPADESAQAASDSNAQFANPAAWWGLLQEQFKQAVSKAMETEKPASSAATEETLKKAGGKKKATAATTSKSKTSAKPGAVGTAKAAPKTAAKTTAKTTGKPAARSSLAAKSAVKQGKTAK